MIKTKDTNCNSFQVRICPHVVNIEEQWVYVVKSGFPNLVSFLILSRVKKQKLKML